MPIHIKGRAGRVTQNRQRLSRESETLWRHAACAASEEHVAHACPDACMHVYIMQAHRHRMHIAQPMLCPEMVTTEGEASRTQPWLRQGAYNLRSTDLRIDRLLL